jgi:VanZ family protein
MQARVQAPLIETRVWSLAWPVCAIYTVLVVYASLYPFDHWRFQGITPWAFLRAPWPPHQTTFDWVSNLLGYVPLGGLLTLALARSGQGRWAWAWGVLVPSLLSLLLEGTQSFLLHRVPSQVDWILNSLGAALGALLAVCMLRWRVLGPWSAFRRACLRPSTGGALVVLALWPLAVLYPTSVPYGLGQVWHRLEAALVRLTEGSVLAGWIPQPPLLTPLSPLTEAVLVAVCLWAPLLLGFAILRHMVHRLAFMALSLPVVVGASVLSASLTYGPQHAWVWLTPPVSLGLTFALAMSLFGLAIGHRAAAVLSLLAWGFALGLLNRAPEVAYLAQSLQTWEQGRFIHFHGLSQWLGWLWPYAAVAVALRLALRPAPPAYNRSP